MAAIAQGAAEAPCARLALGYQNLTGWRSVDLDDLRVASMAVGAAVRDRERLIRELHASGYSLPALRDASGLSYGSVQAIASRGPRTLVTLGYERRTPGDLAEALGNHRVDVLVDVRLTPLSRRKGFSKTKLAEHLDAAGIQYVHDRRLGNPKDNRDGFDAAPASPTAKRYLAQLAGEAVDELVALLDTHRVAILCVEHDAAVCHRGCLAEEVRRRAPATAVLHA